MKVNICIAVLLLFMMACGPKKSTKMILKGSNNMYVAINADSVLVANQSDAGKAVVFSKLELENGKYALKTSNGKFISDDRTKNNKLSATKSIPNEWEQFDIIIHPESKINLKTSANKFVCADDANGGLLVANRDKASDWETFTVEER